jgi:hypothetical protein
MVSGAFHIVALVYILLAGGQMLDNEPVVVLHRAVFKDLDDCQAFLKGAEFLAQKQILADMLANSYKMPTPGEDEDGQAVPAVAITASCEPDNSL